MRKILSQCDFPDCAKSSFAKILSGGLHPKNGQLVQNLNKIRTYMHACTHSTNTGACSTHTFTIRVYVISHTYSHVCSTSGMCTHIRMIVNVIFAYTQLQNEMETLNLFIFKPNRHICSTPTPITVFESKSSNRYI